MQRPGAEVVMVGATQFRSVNIDDEMQQCCWIETKLPRQIPECFAKQCQG